MAIPASCRPPINSISEAHHTRRRHASAMGEPPTSSRTTSFGPRSGVADDPRGPMNGPPAAKRQAGAAVGPVSICKQTAVDKPDAPYFRRSAPASPAPEPLSRRARPPRALFRLFQSFPAASSPRASSPAPVVPRQSLEPAHQNRLPHGQHPWLPDLPRASPWRLQRRWLRG